MSSPGLIKANIGQIREQPESRDDKCLHDMIRSGTESSEKAPCIHADNDDAISFLLHARFLGINTGFSKAHCCVR